MLAAPQILTQLQQIVKRETAALALLGSAVDEQAVEAVRRIWHTRGRVIVTGMGKSGLIARKAAATFCSTGTPAAFLHPADAQHGDLGLVHREDLVLALSKSGETDELLGLLPFLRQFGIGLITITANARSRLAEQSELRLLLPDRREALPDSSAPTCSTTAMLAYCDALALTVMSCRGFGEADFALFHPGGDLGRRLLLRVADLMRHGPDLPVVRSHCTLREVIVTMSRAGLGCSLVCSPAGELSGIFTDGDLRRLLERETQPLEASIGDLMVPDPHVISAAERAVTALQKMQQHRITALPVVDDARQLVGVLHLHDLLRAGLS